MKQGSGTEGKPLPAAKALSSQARLHFRIMAIERRPLVDDVQIPKIFWLVMLLIGICAVAGQTFWFLPQDPFRLTQDNTFLTLIVSVTALIAMVSIQLHYAPKVFPLWYLVPTANLIMLQVLSVVAASWGPGIFWMVFFLFVLNTLLLALSWNELNNSTRSISAEPWVSLVPVSSLLMLASAGIQFASYRPGSSADAFYVPYAPAVWIACAFGIVALFLVKGPKWNNVPFGEVFAAAFLVCVLLTFLLGPIAWAFTGFDLRIGWAVVTIGVFELGVASAKFDYLMRFDSGRAANTLAFIFGYYLALICVIAPWAWSI